MALDIARIQARLSAERFSGWLLYDFDHSNPLALRVLQIPDTRRLKRRWFYFIPATGTPTGVVHRIESHGLDGLPGERIHYDAREALVAALGRLLSGQRRIAMEYSPGAANPYVSKVDAGTVELVRSFDVEVDSSANLVQYFEARWPPEAYPLYREAARRLIEIKDAAFDRVRAALRSGAPMSEQDLMRWVLERMETVGLRPEEPIVAVGPHSGDPHYQTSEGPATSIVPDSVLLLDLWARLHGDPDAVVADFTYMAYTGREIPARLAEIWDITARARDAAVGLIRHRVGCGERIRGWEVDDAAREVVTAAGHAKAFMHRTGHSLGREVHGAGVHADNLEMRDERELIPGIALTVEPGLYLPEFGVRTEVNVLVHEGRIEVHEDPPQSEIERLG
jgi:Xaa-Pro aminopeptidase